MDPSFITTIVTSVGFPIVACLGMAYYVKYITDKHDVERVATSEAHREEMEKVTEALNNNTIAITKLCERLGEEL